MPNAFKASIAAGTLMAALITPLTGHATENEGSDTTAAPQDTSQVQVEEIRSTEFTPYGFWGSAKKVGKDALKGAAGGAAGGCAAGALGAGAGCAPGAGVGAVSGGVSGAVVSGINEVTGD